MNSETKINNYNEICQQYFKNNFGSCSKTDIDLIMFKQFYDSEKELGNSMSDYSLSVKLGITQSKVRALKEKRQLKYPMIDFDWKKELELALRNAHYNEDDHSVKFIIEDVNVKKEVINLIENKGWYDDTSLNKKLLNIPLDCFVEIFYSNDNDIKFDEKTKKALEKANKSKSGILSGFIQDFSKDGLKDLLKSGTKEAICLALGMLPFGGSLSSVIKILIKVIEKA